jgi:hypothetical protein
MQIKGTGTGKKWKLRLGIILISISVVIFLMLFALPFLSITMAVKIALSTAFLVAGEVLFWLGIVSIGKDVYLKFKARLRSGEWMKKTDTPTGTENN